MVTDPYLLIEALQRFPTMKDTSTTADFGALTMTRRQAEGGSPLGAALRAQLRETQWRAGVQAALLYQRACIEALLKAQAGAALKFGHSRQGVLVVRTNRVLIVPIVV